MARTKVQKAQLLQEFSERCSRASSMMIAEYSGLGAGDLAELRRQLRDVDCEFRVIKNRVSKQALSSMSGDSPEFFAKELHGPVGIVYVYGDVASGAKTLLGFAKDHEALLVRGGLVDSKAVSKEELNRISDLPSKEVLLAKIAGSLIAPHRNLLRTIQGVSEKLVRCISAVKDTKEGD